MRVALFIGAILAFPAGRLIGHIVTQEIERPGQEFREQVRQQSIGEQRAIQAQVERDKAEAAQKFQYIRETSNDQR